MRKAAGYSLLELIIVVVILLGGFLAINVLPQLLSVDVDLIASTVASSVTRVRREALRGDTTSSVYNGQKKQYMFNVNTAVTARHPGIVITTTVSPGSTRTCQNNACPNNMPSFMCISGEKFCYSSASSFGFDGNSGRADSNYAIFIISDRRKLAVLVSQDGTTDIAELINNEWRSRTDLQQLHQ